MNNKFTLTKENFTKIGKALLKYVIPSILAGLVTLAATQNGLTAVGVMTAVQVGIKTLVELLSSN